MCQLEVAAAAVPQSKGDLRSHRDRGRPSRWWVLGECGVVGLLAVTVWFGGGGQTFHAVVTFAAASVAAALVAILRLVIVPTLDWRAVFRIAFAPALVLAAFVLRSPMTEAVFEVRFRAAEPTLTAAAQAALADPDAPLPGPAGGWTFTERWRGSASVVFFADRVGPLILKRCGFAYVPEGTTRLKPIRGAWYWQCL